MYKFKIRQSTNYQNVLILTSKIFCEACVKVFSIKYIDMYLIQQKLQKL